MKVSSLYIYALIGSVRPLVCWGGGGDVSVGLLWMLYGAQAIFSHGWGGFLISGFDCLSGLVLSGLCLGNRRCGKVGGMWSLRGGFCILC